MIRADFPSFSTKEFQKVEELSMFLFLIQLCPDKNNALPLLEEGKRKYGYYFSLYTPSISLDSFEYLKGDESEIKLKMIQSFSLYTMDKKKNLSSLFLSFRYFLNLLEPFLPNSMGNNA